VVTDKSPEILLLDGPIDAAELRRLGALTFQLVGRGEPL
jgi:hypothetical protein